jgi:hypothetical protein
LARTLAAGDRRRCGSVAGSRAVRSDLEHHTQSGADWARAEDHPVLARSSDTSAAPPRTGPGDGAAHSAAAAHPGPAKEGGGATRDSVAAAPTPKPKPAPPQPKTRSAAVADPLSLDAPPDWKHFALPQGANAGTVIGGNGDNGSGSGCGGAGAYLPIVLSQIRTVFSRDEKMDDRTFHIQAQLWFDDTGTVQRSQLLQTTGKADLDASIRALLGKIHVGPGMPQCIQPITVWVNHPQDGGAMPPAAHIESWQSRIRARN